MTKYLYGLHEGHERGGYFLAEENGRTMWIVTTHALGFNPEDVSSFDYSPWSSRGHGIIARLNNGYYPEGTIPEVEHYAAFATRVRNWVENSAGCHRWIIGNEMNHEIERPYRAPIYPDSYALCFMMCHDMIHNLPGHEDDEVIVGAVAPYNNQTVYPGNERGDWVQYLRDVLSALSFRPDGISLHAYTHGADPSLVTSVQRMDAPFDDRHFHFYVVFDFLSAIHDLVGIPIYITETNQGDEWADFNSGWVREAYRVVDMWNKTTTGPIIRCLALYRWPSYDQWSIVDKPGVQADFITAMEFGYKTEVENMAEWKSVYFDGLDAFHDPISGAPEVTIPVNHSMTWDESLPRPEMDAKDAELNHPEVWSPRYSAVGFHRYTEFKWWCYTDPIAIYPDVRTRASVMVMIIAHGTTENPNASGNCGMRLGIGGPNETEPDSPNIVWSDWWVVRDNLDNEGRWIKLRTPETMCSGGSCRLFIQCNNDLATSIAAGHWDDEEIEQYVGDEPPPPSNGEHRIEVFLDGKLICEHKFTVGADPETSRLVVDARDQLNTAIALEGWE